MCEVNQEESEQNDVHSFIHSSFFAQKCRHNRIKSKRTELDEKVVKH